MGEHGRAVRRTAAELSPAIKVVAEEMGNAILAGKKILIMGNGGSAADALHFAAELVGRFKRERGALPAVCLNADVATLTAVGNDYDFSRIFQRQVEALANPGDIVFVISTSGESENILLALNAANRMDCVPFGLLGKAGGMAAQMVEHPLVVPSMDPARIQEVHILIIHILCELIEERMFKLKEERI